MAAARDHYNPLESVWVNDEENHSFHPKGCKNTRLIEGISLKDLCDGKEIVFEVNKDGDGDEYVSDEDAKGVDDDIVHSDPKLMREKRGAPPLYTTFNEISDNMTNVDEDGSVKKQLITWGTGKVVPRRAYVTVHYNLYKEKCEVAFDSTYMRNRPEKFRLDQGEAILGLEIAIKSMKKNENSVFFIKWEVAFGAMGCPDRIGPKCNIVADITVLNFEEIDPEFENSSASEVDKIDFEKSLNRAKQIACYAREDFTKGNTRGAVNSYRKALNIFRSMRLADEIQERIMLKQKVKCLVNLAVCYNKLGKPEQTCVACQEVLSIDPNNIKANFHYGRANVTLSNFGIAKKYLLKADRLKPHDKDINNEIKKLNDKKALYDLRDKSFWAKAFQTQVKEEKEKDELPMSLKTFESSLKKSLEESLKEEKPYILPMPLMDDEKMLCERIAAELNMACDSNEDFFVFQKPKKVVRKLK